MVLIDGESIFGAGPDAVAIHQHGEDVIVGQAIGGGEVFKTEHAASAVAGGRDAEHAL